MGIFYIKENEENMEKIKILMVMGSTNMGGTQMFVLNLLRNIDLSRFQIDFVINFEERENGIGQKLREKGCQIYMLPYFKVYNYYSFVKAWKQFLREHQYDIVHGHSTNSASIYLNIAKKAGCITIAHCHSTGFRGNKVEQLLKGFYIKNIRHAADYWFACSKTAAEHLYGKGYDEYEHYYDIPNAINAEKYQYNEIVAKRIRQDLGVRDDELLCGHIGSFTAPKNHAFLLEVFNEVLQIKPNAKLICCGSGPLMPQIREKVIEMEIEDKVIFPGVVHNCNEYLMAMDVFIFPSIFEGFGIALLEAEATGLPIVMSDVIPDDIDITDCVHRLSLNDSAKVWAELVCRLSSYNRARYNKIISDSKYNMRTSVRMVMSLYEEMSKK